MTKRLMIFGVTIAAAILSVGHAQGSATERLQLQVSPTFSMAPASILVRVIVERNAENRQLEIVADSEDFYRRTVVDLEGDRAKRVNELRLIAIPGGEYEVTATLYCSRGVLVTARQSMVVVGR